MRACKRSLGVLVVAAAAAGCSDGGLLGPVDPVWSGDGDVLIGGFRITLTVDPETLSPPGTVTARLRYENQTRQALVLGSAYSCLSFAAVYSDSTRVSFPATDYLCLTVITNREVAAGASVGMDWPLEIGGDGVHLEPGTYRFVANLNTHGFKLEASFHVE